MSFQGEPPSWLMRPEGGGDRVGLAVAGHDAAAIAAVAGGDKERLRAEGPERPARGGRGLVAPPCRPVSAMGEARAPSADRLLLYLPDDLTITTPFVTLPHFVDAACADNGFSYLALAVHGNPKDARIDDIAGDLTPEWGMHVIDVNVAMGDLVRI